MTKCFFEFFSLQAFCGKLVRHNWIILISWFCDTFNLFIVCGIRLFKLQRTQPLDLVQQCKSFSQYHHGYTDQSRSTDQTYNIIDWQTLFTWLWRWLPLRLSKRQSPTTVLFRTTLTRTITLYELLILLGSNHLLSKQHAHGIFQTLSFKSQYIESLKHILQ